VECATVAGHPGPFPQDDEMTAAAYYLKAVFERNDRDEVLELIYCTEKAVATFHFNSILPFGHPNVFSPTEAGVRLCPKLRAAPPNLVGLGQDDSQDNEAQPRMTFPPTEDRIRHKHHHVNPFNIIGIRTLASHKSYTIEQYGFMARDHMFRRQMEPKCGPELQQAIDSHIQSIWESERHLLDVFGSGDADWIQQVVWRWRHDTQIFNSRLPYRHPQVFGQCDLVPFRYITTPSPHQHEDTQESVKAEKDNVQQEGGAKDDAVPM
jgi:hypothetical protein